MEEKEFDALVMKLPSIVDRVKIVSHVAKLAEKASKADAPNSDEEVMLIVQWIRKTWPNHTVRAKMAQKIARLIEEGEHRR